MTETSHSELKERERSAWASVADGWQRQDALLRKGAAPVTARMLELAAITSGSQVLDIASGTGEPAISAAQLAGITGRVIATDLTEEMLAYARHKASEAGVANIEFHCVDGETLDYAADSFDAVTIRWGLMFMPAPVDCLKLARNIMKQQGRIAVACWSAPQKNPFVSLLLQILGNYMEIPKPPPGTPGIFSLADPERLQTVLASAGFQNIEMEELEITVIEVADGQAYWDAISDLAAPVMTMVNQLNNETRESYINEAIQAADSLKQGDKLCMRGTTWLASAEK